FYQPKALKMAYQGLSATFKYARPYCAFIPTYPSGFWSFTMASDVPFVNSSKNVKPGKYFNQDVYTGALKLPQFVKNLIQGPDTSDKKKKNRGKK
ncbi:MAG: hypothetical protein M1166_05150, partial [Candidatus Thermoplasmatota archaeon]|nr:hypothetical protein [Candidatus Thermoplasmatota archaeon]